MIAWKIREPRNTRNTRRTAGWAALLCFLCATGISHAAYLYDMGTPDSAVRPGGERVLADTVYSEETGFGWESTEGLEAQAQAYRDPIENTSRGTTEPPPIYTNELTEDSIMGTEPARFLAKVKGGLYEVHVICGVSSSMRNQYFDFEISVGRRSQRVQIEGGQRFEWRTLHTASPLLGPLAITFSPASRWCVNAIILVHEDETDMVDVQLVRPLAQEIFLLPPDEWEKWKEEPHIDNRPWPRGTEFQAVHRRHYLEPVYSNTVPLAHTLDPELRAFASPGEYEPLTFTLCARLGGVYDVRVEATDLECGNQIIPASEIGVRRAAYVLCRPNYRSMYVYRRNPDYLPRLDAAPPARPDLEHRASATHGNHRFWLTVHVPDDAQPGIYTGKVTFAERDGDPTEIPIRFRVLPIRLMEDPDKIYGIYYRHPLDRAAGAPDDVSRAYFERKAEFEHQDMVAHGTRNITMGVWSPAADEEGKFSFNFDLLARKIDLFRKYDFKPPVVMSFNVGGIYRKHIGESYGSHLRAVKETPPEFAAEVTAAVAEIERERKARGWPEFLYYPIDEPSTSKEAVDFMVTVLKACKAVPGIRTYVTADPTREAFDPMRPFIDIWCTQPFEPDRETVLADSAARGVEYWCYPNHVNGENDHTPVAGARMTYGFGFWRSGFQTLIPWIYQSSRGDPFNYLDGPSMDFFNRSEPDGTPMPVAMWEAYREGYDDYRYIYTLTQLIEQARQAGKEKLADEAQAELDGIWNAIEVQSKYKYDDLWGPEEFDAYRWLIAQQIMRLQ